MTCLQLLSSPLAVLNISSTWASPWNTLARLTYRTPCLFFSRFWLASTIHSLARGLRIQSKRPLPCLLYCTSLGTAQHGWPRYAVAFSLSENAAVLWKRRTPPGSGFTQHITSQSFYPAHELYGSPLVKVCSCSYMLLLMEHNWKKSVWMGSSHAM